MKGSLVLLLVVAAAALPVRAFTGPTRSEPHAEDRVDVTAEADVADRYLGRDREAGFDAYIDFIRSVHCVSSAGMDRIGVPWERALENGRRRFREARSVTDVYYALLSVQCSLRDGHGRFDRKELPVSFDQAVRLDFEAVVTYARPSGGEHTYVVAGSNEPSLPVGSTIVGYAGRSVAEFEADLIEWYNRHTPEGFRDFVARRLSSCRPEAMPCPRPGERVDVVFVDRGGSRRVATLTWRSVDGDADRETGTGAAPGGSTPTAARVEPLPFDFQYLDRKLETSGRFFRIYGTRAADTKILRYFSFNYEDEADFPPEIAAIGDHLRRAGARRVLVDVRENAGGAFMPELVGVFTAQPFRIMLKSFFYGSRIKAHPEAMALDEGLELWTADETRILQQDLASNPAASWSRPIPFFCRSAQCLESEAEVRFDGSPGYETVVLAGPSTFSSGDMFVTIMKDNGIARLAGMPSGAGDAPYRWRLDYPLADGTRVSLRLTTAVSFRPHTDGLTVEGNPPPLDHPLYPTAARQDRYLDAVLDAVGWVQDQSHPDGRHD